MLKKSFFSLSDPHFQYKSLDVFNDGRSLNISASKTITLHIKEALSKKTSEGIKIGNKVKTGEKLYLSDKSSIYVISSVTGTIKTILPVYSDYGASYTAIEIELSKEEHFDENLLAILSAPPNLENMVNFLGTSCPGEPPLSLLLSKNKLIKKIVLYASDSDLFSTDSLNILSNDTVAINEGIKILKTVSGIEDLLLVIPEDSIHGYSDHLDVTVKTVSSRYPYAQPKMIKFKIAESENINFENLCFFKLESIAAIGKAFTNSVLPIKKKIIIIDKKKQTHLTNVIMGTHISHILTTLGISLNDEDKIIIGGPMTGSAVHNEDHPVLANIDIIMLQDKSEISYYSDYPCINCGECIRVCPSKVPVNLLVRFLEAGRYEEGADLYDLSSCVECGLCAYICVSKIPLLQYIKLAKYELNRTGYTEDMNE